HILIFATLLGGRLELIVPDTMVVQLIPAGPSGRGQRAASPAPPPPPGVPVIEVRRVVPGGRIRVVTPRRARRPGTPRWPVSRRRRS
ncbi:MAG: hypothetical protein ABJB47_22620, partial [Actinomycetota bacterium]